jgi:hypothetical protein
VYFPETTANWVALLIFIGTPLAYYTLIAPSFAHAIDAFMLTCAFYCLDATRRKSTPGKWYFYSGAVLGWSGCIRNVNFIFVPVFLTAICLATKSPNYYGSKVRSVLIFVTGLLPFCVFQFFYNHIQYGNAFRFGYQLSGVDSLQSHIIPMLFSITRGYFTWTPMCLLGLLGLILLAIKDKWLGTSLLALMISFFAAAQFFPHWWGGTGFGMRFATLLSVPVAFGTAELINRNPRFSSLFSGIFATFSLGLLILFTVIQHTEPGLRALRLTGTQYRPVQLLEIFKQEMKISHQANPFSFVWETISKGHVPALFPNLTSHVFGKSSAMVIWLKGERDLKNPRTINGKLKICARNRVSGVFSLAVWTYFSPDTPNEYPHSSKSRVFSAEMQFPDGFSEIAWSLIDGETLLIDSFDTGNSLSAQPVLVKPGILGSSGNIHIEAGIFTESIGRFLPLDIEAEETMQMNSDGI